MVNPNALESALCSRFCAGLSVRVVPAGLAIATAFEDSSGDRLGFYAIQEADGWRLEDDGDYLATLIASGIDIDNSQRGELLNRILAEASATWDRDTLIIRSLRCFQAPELSNRVLQFLSGLIRVRDLALLTRETIRSTFRDDARTAIIGRIGQLAEVVEEEPIDASLRDFPSDFVIVPHHVGRRVAIYVVTRNEKLTEAMLLQAEARRLVRRDIAVVALIEDSEMHGISKRNVQRAANRLDAMPIFRGDENAAVETIARAAGLELSGLSLT